MKVLLSAFQCGPGRGSEPGNGWHWATALAEYGHDVTVVTTSVWREPILAAGPQGINFRFVDVPGSPLPSFSRRLRTYDRYTRWQDAVLKHVEDSGQRYDVAHHVTWGSLHMGSKLWRLPMPLVYGPIGGGQTSPANYWRYFGPEWPAETVRTASTGSLLKLIRRSRETLRNSAVTLVCNSDTAAAARRVGAADVRFMLADALPSDWVVDARPRPDGVPTVLWVGRLLRRKAPTLAIQAFAELRRSMPARLVVAGDGPLRGQLRAAVQDLGLTGDVELLGPVTWDDVRRLYDTASVFLFTSLRESFGAPFVEALGRGVPTVALDHHGIGDVDVGPAAVKVPLTPRPRDLPHGLGSALHTVLSDPDWEARSAAAVKWAGEQVWPQRAAAATQIYKEILARRS